MQDPIISAVLADRTTRKSWKNTTQDEAEFYQTFGYTLPSLTKLQSAVARLRRKIRRPAELFWSISVK